jgi:hypothetical protein
MTSASLFLHDQGQVGFVVRNERDAAESLAIVVDDELGRDRL